jgi:deaminated glutathione amidase
MVRKFLVAIVQLDTQQDKAENLARVCSAIDEAGARGAKLVALPEAMNYIGDARAEGGPREPIPGHTTEILARKAREHGIFVHGGSIAEAIPGEERSFNTSVMIDPSGVLIAKYRKLHTFDVTLPDGSPIRESDTIRPGSDIVTVDTELGMLGFTICYDIRFPELFRLLALRGARIIFAPANFTLPTGKDHWEVILRTRAIENGCYIVAPAQIGKKPRFTAFGNSLVVDPWGTVIARAKDEPGVTIAEIDLDFQDRIRTRMPSLENRRSDVYDLRARSI